MSLMDEQKLLADFRQLNGDGQQELLQYAAMLLKKQENRPAEETAKSQCPLDRAAEERPEAREEPIFTE